MAEQEGKKAKLSFDIEELQALVTAAVVAASKENQESTQAIVQALLDARKPYSDPKQKAVEAITRDNMKRQAAKQLVDFELVQDNCPHKKGSSPLSWYNDPNNSSFAIHTLDTGEIIGICTNCTKVISSLNLQHRAFFAQSRGTNIRSAAGRRDFGDQTYAAQRARLGPTKEIFVDESTGKIVEEPVAAN